MIDLSRHIEYLLLYTDRVEVPLLGTFQAKYIPSVWVEDEFLFLPPCRVVSYSPETKDGEGFLKSLSTQYGISVEEAGILCMEFSENIKQELRDNGTSEIGSIGYFVQEGDAVNRVFVPCEAGVASPSLYGLDAMCMTPIKQQDIPVDKKKNRRRLATMSADKEYVTIKVNRKFANYMTAIAASVLFFVLFTTPAGNSVKPDMQRADTEIFTSESRHLPTDVVRPVSTYKVPVAESKPVPTKIETEENTVETPAKAKEEACAPAPKAKTEKAETPEPKVKAAEAKTAEPKNVATKAETPKATVKQATAKDEYAVVLASALSLKNAEKYSRDLMNRGYNVCIQTGGKMNRVIMPGFKSMDEAHAKIKQMRAAGGDEFNGAWVLKID